MLKLVNLSQIQAIKIMDENLSKIKELSGCNTFILLSYDLEHDIPLQRKRIDKKGGKKVIKSCESFILSKEYGDEDAISVLSMYTEKQKDIYNIFLAGKKYDMVII